MGKKIQEIGRYVMDGTTLGKGNFARVELATHGVCQIKVAIKVIDTKKIKEDYVRANLHREARIMAHLRHPNIIRLYETMKATTLYCLVLEYAAGGELLAYIKSQENSRLTETAARPFIRQLISALKYIHERGVVHRDLKMENIMLDAKKKNIKIIDFGLSNIYRDDDPLKTHCGSPEYAAPELFVVGKTYGPEIDIWSLGIITYAMTIGKLPFFTPFKDEYQRQRMLQQIQKGLSQYHDREMQLLTPDLRNLVHQLIEPNPELRIPLSEIPVHPWLTKNGKAPFTMYVPPPRDKNLRHQVIQMVSIMMNMKRPMVEEIVKEHKADELSALFNMLLDQKKKEAGYFDHDHTLKKCAKRDRDSRSRSGERAKTPDSMRSRLITGKNAPRKIPRSGKAGPSSKANLATPTSAGTPSRSRPARIVVDADSTSVHPNKPPGTGTPSAAAPGTSGNPGMLGVPAETHGAPGTANGPTTRIPLSQRRVPPAKLNLTLDLSVTNLSSAVQVHHPHHPRRTMSTSSSQDPDAVSTTGGVAASSGVRPRISTSPSKIPVVSPSRPSRPSTLHYVKANISSIKSKAMKTLHIEQPRKVAPAEEEEEEDSIVGSSASRLVAPKATPEDSLIDSYSTTDEEEDEEDEEEDEEEEGEAMQSEMLNRMDTRDEVLLEEVAEEEEEEVEAAAAAVAEGLHAGGLPEETAVMVKQLLLKQISDAASSGGSGSTLNPSQTQLLGSGSSLPAKLPRAGTSSPPATIPPPAPQSTACLLQPPPVNAPRRRAKNLTFTLSLSNPTKLNGQRRRRIAPPLPPPIIQCRSCGLSPGSPTYYQHHNKWCHTGAHALDVFVSPDEAMPTLRWPSLPSTSAHSPTQQPPHYQQQHQPAPGPSHAYYRLPRVGADTPMRRLPLPHSTLTAAIHDFSDDDDDDDDYSDDEVGRPLLASSPPLPASPSPPPPLPHPATAQPHIPTKSKSLEKYKSSARDRRKTRLSPVMTTTTTTLTGSDPTLRLLADLDTVKEEDRLANGDNTRQPQNSTVSITQEEGSSSSTSGKHQAPPHYHDVETATGDMVGGKTSSRIPRPAQTSRAGGGGGGVSLSAKLHVFGLLSQERRNSGEDSETSSMPATPPTDKRSEKNSLLKQYDHKTKQYSWRQGLSHLLRMTRPNNNNILKTKTSNGKCNNGNDNKCKSSHSSKCNSTDNKCNSTDNKCNSTELKCNSSSEHKTSRTPAPVATSQLTCNSHSSSSSSSSNKCNSVSSRFNAIGNKTHFFSDMESKWTGREAITNKCNDLQVTSVAPPTSFSGSHHSPPPMYEMTTMSMTKPTLPPRSPNHRGSSHHHHHHHHQHKPSSKAAWTGCKECAKTDQSSDEGVEMTLVDKLPPSPTLKPPAPNNLCSVSPTTKV